MLQARNIMEVHHINKLLDLLSKNPAISPLSEKRGVFVVDDTIGVSFLFAGLYHKKPGNYTIVAANLYVAQKIANILSSLIGEENVLFFPTDEALRTEVISVSKELLAQRLYVMNECVNAKNKILVCHISSCLTPLPTKEEYIHNSFKLKLGQEINLNQLKKNLVLAGYLPVNKIDQSLQFASRGDVLDIFSVNYDNPIRIDFFGDEIDGIHFFDIATQTSKQSVDEVLILPANELLISDDEIVGFKNKLDKSYEKDILNLPKELHEQLKLNIDNDYENISNHLYHPRLNKYYKYIKNKTSSILDYFDSELVFLSNVEQIITSATFSISEANSYLKELYKEGQIINNLSMYFDYDEVINKQRHILYSNQYQKSSSDICFNIIPLLMSKTPLNELSNLIMQYINTHNKVVISFNNKQQLNTVEMILKDNDIKYENLVDLSIPEGKVGLTIFALEEGFELKDDNIAFISSNELFGYHNRSSKFLNRYKEATILKSYEDLRPGDYVVHEFYGIGQFKEVKTEKIDGIFRDYLYIEYAKKDAIYVPLSQFKSVKKYASREGYVPKLSTFGGKDWEKTKNRIKERINELADRLYKLYSDRNKVEGFQFAKDDEIQLQFENEFPYELTVDQQKSLQEIKEDMEKPVAMDRLLCGDVGFGKTEVAFRAIFKCILSNKQAALLCPTTLLARQHYERAIERFSHYGIKIGILSRLISDKVQKDTINKLSEGKIDLLIGTHRILSKEVRFKDLGLLVIDEEQRFGVEQKEKIKELKNNIDVLSLSATPIPRTLQLSLIGLRSVSQIETPPTNRTPIQTYVIPYNKKVSKELIERELSRKGQVFYVHNKVYSIHHKAEEIQSLVPSAKIGVIHGQMEKDEIDDVMTQFYNGEINVLIATSIIENGIDVPNANLILIENADHFGLAQLYQIKGRVGRGDRIAHAYLFYNENKEMNSNAKKRLKAIQDFAEFGSGYKIAQRDLMIRGAGDILGPEQAGFIDSVGLDLYLKLLNEVIEEKKTGEKVNPPKPVTMFKINAYIPEKYAINEDKIGLYQEIESCKNEKEIKTLRRKVRDIYGRIPEEVEKLFDKRKIDIYLQGEEFDKVIEYNDNIELSLTKAISAINGIGSELFDVLSPFTRLLNVTYSQKILKLRLKKTPDWLDNLQIIIECIHETYERHK